jgi:hypothetical protein
MFCSDSFRVPVVSLVPNLTIQLMSAEQINDHDCRDILNPDFCYIQNRRTGHLVGTGPDAVAHSVFGSLTGSVFLPLRLPVLPVLLSLLRPHRRFISDIIVCVIFVDFDYLLCFIKVF